MAKQSDRIWSLGMVGQRIGYLLHRADLLHMRLIREELAVFGLTPARATALAFVHENKGCCQNDLGQALEINRASTMELVNSLVTLGAIERRGAADRRTNALFVTVDGAKLFDRFLVISEEVDEAILAHLSDADRDGLVKALGGITRSLVQTLNAAGEDTGRPNPKPELSAVP